MLSYYLEHKVKNTLQNKVVAVASEFEIGVRLVLVKQILMAK